MKFKKCIAFDDVLLKPRHSAITSRKEVSIATNLSNLLLDVPIISSPMDTITGARMASKMSYLGGLGVIHRYNSIEEQVKEYRSACDDFVSDPQTIACAIGLKDAMERVAALSEKGCRIFCVDVAHGHHESVYKVINKIKTHYHNEDLHLMAGNVATYEGFRFLEEAGADSIRVGIGSGSICSTRIETGHGVPLLQSILDIVSGYSRNRWLDMPHAALIADGGIRNAGDIVKALAAGAQAVMVGSLLAGADETPNPVNYSGSKILGHKVYRGMASPNAQKDWRGVVSSKEGVQVLVKSAGPVVDIIEYLTRNIKSGLSYSGARTIPELQEKAKFIKQSLASINESRTHIHDLPGVIVND